MKLGSSFTVPGSPDKVLTLFLDPATMQVCLPGCDDLTQVDENHYRGTLVNEVAHVKFKASFVAEIVERDLPSDPTKPATVKAVLKGEDRRLGSTVKLDALLVVSPVTGADDGDTSQVTYEMEMALWGKLGRLGEPVVRRRTAEVEKQFAEALTAVCAGRPVPQSSSGKKRTKGAAVQAVPAAQTGGEDGSIATSVVAVEADPRLVAPAGRRAQGDWAVLGLAVAAAFAYGMIAGRLRGETRR